MPQNGQRQPEEEEGFSQLTALVKVVHDSRNDLSRLKRMKRDGKVDASGELVDTVMSGQVDMGEATIACLKEITDWILDASDVIFSEDEDEDGDDEETSLLMPEDAQVIRAALELAQAEVTTQAARDAIQSALQVVADLTAEDEDEEASDNQSDDEESEAPSEESEPEPEPSESTSNG